MNAFGTDFPDCSRYETARSGGPAFETPTARPPSERALGVVDGYELVRRLGSGGFGVVYLARDLSGGREVAVKTLHPLLKHDAKEVEKLREQFKMLSGLPHPNIATAFSLLEVHAVDIRDERARADLDLSPGDPLMVMGYAPGETLAEWKKARYRDGVVPVDLALEIGRQTASALDYAHANRVVHCDIKPGNLVVETLPDGRGIHVRILDFGLAERIHSRLSRRLSEEGRPPEGTYPYMAPEMWTGDAKDGRTDQYALACVLHELLSGAPPFADAFSAPVWQVMREAVLTREPERRIPGVPSALAAVLRRALSKSPEDRYLSCSDFIEAALAAAAADGSSASSATDRADALLDRRDREFLAAMRAEFLPAGHSPQLAALASGLAAVRFAGEAVRELDRFAIALLDELAAANPPGGALRPLEPLFSGRGRARLDMVKDIPERGRTEVQRRIVRLLAVAERLCG